MFNLVLDTINHDSQVLVLLRRLDLIFLVRHSSTEAFIVQISLPLGPQSFLLDN